MLIKITAIITTIILLLPQNGLCLRPVATRIYAESKPPITKELVIDCCKNGKDIEWKKYRLTPEFARWILEIFAKNSRTYNRSPENVTLTDLMLRVKALNGRYLSAVLKHTDIRTEEMLSGEKGYLVGPKIALKNLKLLAGYEILDEKPILTEKIVRDCCENGKYIPWSEHRLTTEFARWILEIIAQNSHVAGRRPDEITLGDFRKRVKALNNRYMNAILEHPDIQEKDKPLDEKRALKNLKLLAGYNPVENSIRPPMTKEIVINCCENGKYIPWKKHRLTPEFARWILEIVAENSSFYNRRPQEVTIWDFDQPITIFGNRKIRGVLNHPDLGKKDNPLIGLADALKNLKLLAGYKLKNAKSTIAYKKPVDKIISKEAGLEDAAYNQIKQLITQMHSGNLIAKERLKKLFNPHFDKIRASLEYKLYSNNQIHDKKWAKKELFQQLDIEYENIIEKLNIKKVQEDYFVPQIKTFIKANLTWHYYAFYNKLQKQDFKEPLILNGAIRNGKENERFANGKEVIDSISGEQPSPEDILGIVNIIQKLISVMDERNISAKNISLFFDFYLSGLTQRNLGFKYNISRNTTHYTVNEKILKTRHISRQDIYHEFLKEVKSIKEHIDYIPIIEQYPAIREFRKGLRQTFQKSSSAGKVTARDKEKPPITKEIVISCCENGKYIPWKEYRLTPEFARWLLEIVAENSPTYNRSPEDVTVKDISIPIRALNNRIIHGILDHSSIRIEAGLILKPKDALKNLKFLAGYNLDDPFAMRKPILTEEIVIDCCKNGKDIQWKKHRLTPEFARWILNIIAENSLASGRRPEDVTTEDMVRPITVLNNHRLLPLLEHPALQEKDRPLNEKRALKNLKLLAGYNPVENSVREPMTKEIVINYCENGKRIQWKKYRLTPEFARWLLEIVAKNMSDDIKPEDVTTEAFNQQIKALNNRAVGGIFNHPDLGKKENSFIGCADALKNLKLLAGYKPESAKLTMTYEEPVDKIISKEAGLNDVSYSQIEQLITGMRNNNLTAKERLKKLFNPYFKNVRDNLKYKLYDNNQIHDKKWAEKELFQQLDIKYEYLIEKLKTEKIQEDYFVPQIKTFIKTSLTWHYYSFYRKLQKQDFKEPLILNGVMPNGKENERFANGKEIIDSVAGEQPSPEDILGTVNIIHNLISVMEGSNISAKDISLFFDFYLSGLTQRDISFKYNISRNTPHYIVNQKIPKTRYIFKLDIYHEFLKEAEFIKKHIDYIPIIEQYPAIREFRKGLRESVYDIGGVKPVICLDTHIIARVFASSV